MPPSTTSGHHVFRTAWRSTNVLLAPAILALLCAGGWEYSAGRYLQSFSDAIIPAASTPEIKQ